MLALVDGLQLQWLYDRDSVKVAATVRKVFEGLLTVSLEELNKLEERIVAERQVFAAKRPILEP